ncbi:MAG: GyrI-like domain-containing protein [Chitinophagales bacterium]|nr:GyrI-like domain-containing protein [Chitinophagales bacterium]
MNPRFETILEKKLIGNKSTMSFANYKIGELWKVFMPKRHSIKNNLNSDLISLTIYPPNFFTEFEPTRAFEKWAVIEVSDFENTSTDFEKLILPSGLYAVFNYKGSSNDNSIFKYIMQSWLPDSNYQLDNRPHFEVLGSKYKNNDPLSEEEIWIPIREK